MAHTGDVIKASQRTAITVDHPALPPVDRGRLLRSVRRSRMAVVGTIVLLLVVLVALAGPVLVPQDPVAQNLASALKPPAWEDGGSWAHILGTDQFGRDILARLVHGARISLIAAILAAALGGVVGVLLGLVSGYYGRWADNVVMRLVDLQLAFPLILLALAMVAVLGPSLKNLVIAMAITGWTTYARMVRATVLSLAKREFVEAALSIGARDWTIMLRHILPNTLAPILVVFTLEMARLVLMEASLSFLGLGVPPPTPTWGRMLSEGRDYMTVAPWVVFFPGVAIMLLVLGINFLGDGLRDALDPRLRRISTNG